MKLVDDLSLIWKRWSVKIMAAQVTIVGVYAGLNIAGIAPTIADWIKHCVFFLLSAAALTVAPLKQSNLPPSV